MFILAISDGLVDQFGPPHELLCQEAGTLADLVTDTGPDTSQRLREMAREAYCRRDNNLGTSELNTKL